MEDSSKQSSARLENIYQLDGRVPLDKAIPFGLQHVLAMFIANLAPSQSSATWSTWMQGR